MVAKDPDTADSDFLSNDGPATASAKARKGCHVKNVQNLAGPATAPTETSSGYAEFFVDATANSNSRYGGIIRETCS